MSTPDKKEALRFLFCFVFLILIAVELLRVLTVDWFYNLIACVAHGEQNNVYIHAHNYTSTKGKNHVFVLLLNNSDSNR